MKYLACLIMILSVTGCSRHPAIQRYGMVTGIKPDSIGLYKQLHAAVWPGVLQQIKASNISNYSIYLQQIEDKYYLFSYFEYTGTDFKTDMAKMAADSTTQKWWRLTALPSCPCPEALATRQTWTKMEEVFHMNEQ